MIYQPQVRDRMKIQWDIDRETKPGCKKKPISGCIHHKPCGPTYRPVYGKVLEHLSKCQNDGKKNMYSVVSCSAMLNLQSLALSLAESKHTAYLPVRPLCKNGVLQMTKLQKLSTGLPVSEIVVHLIHQSMVNPKYPWIISIYPIVLCLRF